MCHYKIDIYYVYAWNHAHTYTYRHTHTHTHTHAHTHTHTVNVFCVMICQTVKSLIIYSVSTGLQEVKCSFSQ